MSEATDVSTENEGRMKEYDDENAERIMAELEQNIYVNRNGRTVPLNLPDDTYNPAAVTPEEGERVYALLGAVFTQAMKRGAARPAIFRYPDGLAPDEALMWCRALLWRTESGEMVPFFRERTGVLDMRHPESGDTRRFEMPAMEINSTVIETMHRRITGGR
jgi:hypothetical protein